MENHILQVNLKNRGGAFSIIYEASKVLYPEITFDYFSDGPFFYDEVYNYLVSHGSTVYDKSIEGNRFIKQFKLYKLFLNTLKNKRYKIVHINTDTAWKAFIYVRAAKKMNVDKIIVHSHSCGVNGHYRVINYLLHYLSIGYVSTFSTSRCACSINAANWMFGNSMGVTLIRNAVNSEKYKFNKEARLLLQKQYNIKKNTVVIGTVGDYSYAKNPEFLIKLIKLFKNNANYLFILIGYGKGKDRLLQSIKAIGMNNIINIGQVTNVEDYLSLLDVFILPSRFEGIPMSAIEAQSCGCYTLVSNKISKETAISKYYIALELNVKRWLKTIESLNFDYNREKQHDYLCYSHNSIFETAAQLKSLYEG